MKLLLLLGKVVGAQLLLQDPAADSAPQCCSKPAGGGRGQWGHLVVKGSVAYRRGAWKFLRSARDSAAWSTAVTLTAEPPAGWHPPAPTSCTPPGSQHHMMPVTLGGWITVAAVCSLLLDAPLACLPLPWLQYLYVHCRWSIESFDRGLRTLSVTHTARFKEISVLGNSSRGALTVACGTCLCITAAAPEPAVCIMLTQSDCLPAGPTCAAQVERCGPSPCQSVVIRFPACRTS